MSRLPVLLVLLALLVLPACGGNDDEAPAAGQGPTPAELREDLKAATQSSIEDFPEVAGRTLQQVADGVGATGTEVGLASSVFTPGENRLAFGVIDRQTGFVYGKTAVYVARAPDESARGPFPAPADLLLTDPPFRSRTAASEDDPFAAVYATQVRFRSAGDHAVLVITQVDGALVAATTQVRVISKRRDPVVGVGERPPAVATETLESAQGDVKKIDTRIPPSDMHASSFADVVGRKPVALLFATPQLCQSRVCGPVVDIAAQLKAEYGDRMEFIHQEVFVDNKIDRGLRRPLKQFGLPTEPWLFTVGSDGRVAARLEGSFGLDAFERAIKAAL